MRSLTVLVIKTDVHIPLVYASLNGSVKPVGFFAPKDASLAVLDLPIGSIG